MLPRTFTLRPTSRTDRLAFLRVPETHLPDGSERLGGTPSRLSVLLRYLPPPHSRNQPRCRPKASVTIDGHVAGGVSATAAVTRRSGGVRADRGPAREQTALVASDLKICRTASTGGLVGGVSVFAARTDEGRLVADVAARMRAGPGFRDGFRGVEAARTMSGAFLAPVVDADADAQVPWLATEFTAGLPLRQVVDRHGPLSEPALRVLADGLARRWPCSTHPGRSTAR